jgi:hypothetical protein
VLNEQPRAEVPRHGGGVLQRTLRKYREIDRAKDILDVQSGWIAQQMGFSAGGKL